ncbi:MAG: regulatory iron-sulfur-containing complex subunit RicT [Candidatus Gracilibacteria bacterium]|nr:regulatory iron-sulfur-containing complex subunit RicT [Candidatus Gracilibacteria bacterium]
MKIAVLEIYPTEAKFLVEVPEDIKLKKGDYAIINYPDVGEEAGRVLALVERENIPSAELSLVHGLSDFLRQVTPHDMQLIEANQKKIPDAIKSCEEKIREHELDMKLIAINFSFNGKGILIIFTAENRVDFRNLVRDLARTFQKQVRLKQIGPRDRSQLVGGYGRCGRSACCASWLPELKSITMDMVRTQNMTSKGASKISGLCGKLLCCLRYEVEIYKELAKDLPGYGSIVKVGKKEGRVIGWDILNQKLKVQYAGDEFDLVDLSKVKVIKTVKEKQYEKSPEDVAGIEG